MPGYSFSRLLLCFRFLCEAFRLVLMRSGIIAGHRNSSTRSATAHLYPRWLPSANAGQTRSWLPIWIVTAFSILMTTRLTAPIWLITPGLSYLFFPYRWLVVASVGACLLAPLSVWVMRDGKWRNLKITALAIVVVLNLAISALAIWRAPVAPDGFAGGLSRRDTREYRPKWWDGQLRREQWQSVALVESGDAQVNAIDDSGIEQSYSVKCSCYLGAGWLWPGTSLAPLGLNIAKREIPIL